MSKNYIGLGKVLIGIILMLTLQALQAKAAPGDYDPSFGIGGISEHQGMDLFSHQIALQNDGKILVAGYEPNNNPNPLILRRHNADGSRDMTFGYQGEAVQKISPTDYRYIYARGVSEIAVQPDGKILIGGSRYNSNGFLGLSVWRFTSAGFLDTTFDTDGRKDIYTPINGEEATLIQTLKITKSKVLGVDKIQILAGYPIYEASNFGIADRSIIYRLNLDGSLDTNFGNGGKIKLDGEVYDMATHKPTLSITGNLIYAAGRNKDGTPTVWRFTQNGLLDANFADSGKFAVNVGQFTTRFFTNLLVQPDGKILVSGVSSMIGFDRNFVLRLFADGTPDSQFGNTIFYGTNISGIYESGYNFGLSLQTDGKIISCCNGQSPRYLSDGTADTGFQLPYYLYWKFVIQRDNKLVSLRYGAQSYELRRTLPN